MKIFIFLKIYSAEFYEEEEMACVCMCIWMSLCIYKKQSLCVDEMIPLKETKQIRDYSALSVNIC